MWEHPLLLLLLPLLLLDLANHPQMVLSSQRLQCHLQMQLGLTGARSAADSAAAAAGGNLLVGMLQHMTLAAPAAVVGRLLQLSSRPQVQ
jgi:hypothetical protein